jgi:hypothetical protein
MTVQDLINRLAICDRGALVCVDLPEEPRAIRDIDALHEAMTDEMRYIILITTAPPIRVCPEKWAS